MLDRYGSLFETPMNTTLTKLGVQQIARRLGQVSQVWLDPAHPLRQEAVTALQVSTGFTRPMIESALNAAFEELTEEKISMFCAQERIAEGTVPEKVLHILAGNVFTAWLPGAVITLLMGSECHLKLSTRESVFAPFWKRSLEAIDRE